MKWRWILFLMPAAVTDPTFALEPQTFRELMEQDFQTFDQSPLGWRQLAKGDNSTSLEIAQLIDAYHLDKMETLTSHQRGILYFHAGQNYAFAQLPELSLRRFANSLNPGEPANPEFHWNDYVRATIAFMKKDRAQLEAAMGRLGSSSHFGDAINFAFVKRFERCFDFTYAEAYSGTGRCQTP